MGQANRRLAKFASAGRPHTTAATKRAALIIAYVTDIAASAETVRMAGVAQRQLNPFLVASEQEQALVLAVGEVAGPTAPREALPKFFH